MLAACSYLAAGTAVLRFASGRRRALKREPASAREWGPRGCGREPAGCRVMPLLRRMKGSLTGGLEGDIGCQIGEERGVVVRRNDGVLTGLGRAYWSQVRIGWGLDTPRYCRP